MIRNIALTLATLTCLAGQESAAQPSAAIARVENGLLPPVTAIGEPTRTMRIADRMAHYKVPAVSIALIQDGRVAWTRAYGTTSAGGGTPATPRTLFQAGSLSKPVAAAGALALVRDGRLSLDGPASASLRSWRLAQPEGEKVTLRRLLSHTAGINVHGFRGYRNGERLPTLRQALDGSAPAGNEPIRVVQAPGAALLYSGGGYLIVQQMVEDSAGRPFAAAMRDSILRPLGMADSLYVQPLPEALGARAAVGHTADGNALPGRWHVFPEAAAAGLWTTPADLARFVVWLVRGARNADSPAGRMLQAQADPEGRPFKTPSGSHAGLGLVLEGTGATFRFSHSGSNPGQKALLIGFPETGAGAVIMANSDSSPGLIQEILRALAAEYRWPQRFHQFAPSAS
jgi:CubicO group peptidase (beta-lactamase class C family)